MSLYTITRASPLVVVLGATGCGKSKLALEIASRYNGEIISADSMQVYKELDIITNKVTKEEQALVKHHLLGFADPLSSFTVQDFRKLVLPLIDELCAIGKLPVIVGGTHYYLEAILWNFLLSSNGTVRDQVSSDSERSNSDTESSPVEEQQLQCVQDLMALCITHNVLRSVPGPTLHQFLKEIDPERADTLHPNDRRKIIRSLQVYQDTGTPHSQHLSSQHKSEGGCSVSGALRFPNAHMFWVQCEQTVLNKRLDDRVDDMISKGLVKELTDFHNAYNMQRINSDQTGVYTNGIFQSIGFKEFHKYLLLPDAVKQSPEGKVVLEECISAMKTVTRQYSKKQIRWIEGRFLRRSSRQVPPIYRFDATEVEHWNTRVRDPAFEIIECIMKGGETDAFRIPVKNSVEHNNKTFYCDVCEKPIVGSLQWQVHLQSKPHYKLKRKKRRQCNNSDAS